METYAQDCDPCASHKRPFQGQIRSSPNASKRSRPSESPPESQFASGLVHLRELYQQHWESLPPGSHRSNPFVVREVYSVIASNHLNHNELYQMLEDTQYNERVLWPTLLDVCRQFISEKNDLYMRVVTRSFLKIFNHYHRTNRQRAEAYKLLEAESSIFPSVINFLFQSGENWEEEYPCEVLQFLSHAFYALHVPSIRTTLSPLVSLPAWINLSPSGRASNLEANIPLQSHFSKIQKKIQKRKPNDVPPLPERFVKTILQNFEREMLLFVTVKKPHTRNVINAHINLLTTILSNPRLCRFMRPLLDDRATFSYLIAVHAIVDVHGSPTDVSSTSLAQTLHVIKLFKQAMNPTVDISNIKSSTSQNLLDVQLAAYTLSEDTNRPDCSTLRSLSLRTHNFVHIETLTQDLMSCTDDSLDALCEVVNLQGGSRFFASKKKGAGCGALPESLSRELKIHALASFCLPTNGALYELQKTATTVSDKDVRSVTALNSFPPIFPVMNQVFHSLAQCMLCNFSLCKWESAHRIGEVIEGAMRLGIHNGPALPLRRIRVFQVTPPLPGNSYPQSVLVSLELERSHACRDSQELMSYGDLVCIMKGEPGTSNPKTLRDGFTVRGLVIENETRPLQSVLKRGLVCKLDPIHYFNDTKSIHLEENAYDGFDILLRVPRGVSELHAMLRALKRMTLTYEKIVPEWLKENLVGAFPQMTARVDGGVFNIADDAAGIDFRDTFLSREHLSKSFPSKIVVFLDSNTMESGPNGRSYYRVAESGSGDESVLEATCYYPLKVRNWLSNDLDENPEHWNMIEYTNIQVEAICRGMQQRLTLLNLHSKRDHRTDNIECISQLVRNLYHGDSSERLFVVCRTEQTLSNFLSGVRTKGVDAEHVLHFGQSEQIPKYTEDLMIKSVIEKLIKRKHSLLSTVKQLAVILRVSQFYKSWTCSTAAMLWKSNILPAWERYRVSGSHQSWEQFPFRQLFEDQFKKGATERDSQRAFGYLQDLFRQLEHLQFLEVLSSEHLRMGYLLSTHARIIGMTTATAASQREFLLSQGFSYTTIVVLEAGAMLEAETLIAMALQGTRHADNLRRAILVSDQMREFPSVFNSSIRNVGNLQQSLFTRLERNGVTVLSLT